jgi:hypothetical protein
MAETETILTESEKISRAFLSRWKIFTMVNVPTACPRRQNKLLEALDAARRTG